MKKNVGSQVIGVQLTTAADGTAFTGTATVVITIDGGTQSASGGTGPTHEGNGYHTYIPTQAETNGDIIGFTFTGSGAITTTVQVYTTFPQTGDSFAEIGTAGASLTDLGGMSTAMKAEVNAEADTALSDYGANTTTPPTAVAIADQVWDEAKSGHVGAGSFGEEVQAHALSSEVATAQSDLDTLTGTDGATLATSQPNYAPNTTTPPTSAAIADAVLDEALSGHVAAGSLGKAVADIETDATAILADTNELQTDDIPGLIAALNDLSAANVNAEVLDVMNTDTLSMPAQGAPSATPTHREAIMWLFKNFRNKKTQTATTWSLYNDDTTTVDSKATVSDDATTATKGEIATGP